MKGMMIQGTASNVGKSFIGSVICRLLRDEGYSIAPFKAQNLTNNIYINNHDEKITVSQSIQARAARVEPSKWMSPLIHTLPDKSHAEMIVLGRTKHNNDKPMSINLSYDESIDIIKKSLDTLQKKYDALVLEGAGSPVELNLKATDIANMKTAQIADVPVVLVSSMNEGGVFASIIGTLELLEAEERARVKGIIINKFQGELSNFQDAVELIENKTNLPVLGVIPYIKWDQQKHVIDLQQADSALDELVGEIKPFIDIKKIVRIAGLHAND